MAKYIVTNYGPTRKLPFKGSFYEIPRNGSITVSKEIADEFGKFPYVDAVKVKGQSSTVKASKKVKKTTKKKSVKKAKKKTTGKTSKKKSLKSKKKVTTGKKTKKIKQRKNKRR